MLRPLRTFARTIAQNFWLPKPEAWAPVLVISPGGVGTTFLMEHIAKYTRTNHIHDEDRLKHLPRPPAGFPKEDVAVIYVTGDVRLITASLERRGFLDHHCCKLGSVGGLLASGDLKRRLFARAVKVQRRNWSEAGIKRFMALEFEEIWHRAGEIAAFLEINDPSFVAAFPPRKTRNTHAPETAA